MVKVTQVAALVVAAGYRRALASLTMEDRGELVVTLQQFYTLLCVKPELDQFLEGLKTLQVLQTVRLYPELLRPLFVAGEPPKLDRGTLMCVLISVERG